MTLWLSEPGFVLEKLIEIGVVAFREKLSPFNEAIIKLDDEGGRTLPSGYWTNLGFEYERLLHPDNKAVYEQVLALCDKSVPRWIDRDELCVLNAEELWDKDENPSELSFTKSLIAHLKIKDIRSADLEENPYINPDEPDESKRRLIPVMIVTVRHTQKMVSLWRKIAEWHKKLKRHDREEHIQAVFALHGASSSHIQHDLKLPHARYTALVSQDMMRVIAPSVRANIIPERIQPHAR